MIFVLLRFVFFILSISMEYFVSSLIESGKGKVREEEK